MDFMANNVYRTSRKDQALEFIKPFEVKIEILSFASTFRL